MVTIVVDAAVAATERGAVDAAAKLLADALDEAGMRASVGVRWRNGLASLDAAHEPTIAVASVQLELERDGEPLAATEARWRERLAPLVRGVPVVIVCTILRQVAEPPGAGTEPARMSRIERIRRLDRMAIELSHDTGARIADVDCMVAHVGARRVGADHRLANAVVAEVAAWAIVRAALAGGLDDLVAPEVQETARASLGEPWNLAKFVSLRLARR